MHSNIDLGVGCTDANMHHNILRHTHGGLHFKVSLISPVFIHCNRLIDTTPSNIWLIMDTSPAEDHVYHNTIVGSNSMALVFSSFKTKRNFSAPEWYCSRQHLSRKKILPHGCRNTPAPDFTAAHNVSIGAGMPWFGDEIHDQCSRSEVAIQHDASGLPTLGTVAADAGIYLSTDNKGKPPPGCERD